MAIRGMDRTASVTGTGFYTNYADKNKDNEMIARDVDVVLPEITFESATIEMMGEFNLPIQERIASMELEIKRIGVDNGLIRTIHPGVRKWEIRFMQRTFEGGELKNVEVKVFVDGVVTGIPSLDIKPGETIEGSVKMSVFRYIKYVAGKEQVKIDRRTGIVMIHGKDLTKNERSFFG